MVLRKFMGIFAITLIVCSASLAMAGIPDASECDSNRFEGGDKAILLVVPGGAADRPFDTAHEIGHPYDLPVVEIDATIQVTVRDAFGVEIANYPFEDIWLECPDLGDAPGAPDLPLIGLVPCTGGATADFSTEVDGYTEFKNPPFAGGHSWGPTRVVINGDGLSNTVNVGFVSPDLNGDGIVNLLDLSDFTLDYFDSVYHFRSDLWYDEILNLLDVPLMAQYYQSACP